MSRILLADDETDLVWAVRYSLLDEGHEVTTASNGMEALALARRARPDLVILDIAMPEMDGLEVCSRLRRDPTLASVPILFLTVWHEIEDRVAGLDEGSDDYLAKPFDMRELKARVRALLRRSSLSGQAAGLDDVGPLLVGPLALDLRGRRVQVGTKVVQLTPIELDLLHYLMLHPGQVFSSRSLLCAVWGYALDAAALSLVRWHVRNLRSKIETDPSNPQYIRTIPRQGYILSADM